MQLLTQLNDLYLLMQEAIRTVQPIFLLYLVSYFMYGSSITKLEAYLYAMGVTLSSMLSVVLHQLYFFNGHRTGMHLRIATTGCVYRKASVSVICRGAIGILLAQLSLPFQNTKWITNQENKMCLQFFLSSNNMFLPFSVLKNFFFSLKQKLK